MLSFAIRGVSAQPTNDLATRPAALSGRDVVVEISAADMMAATRSSDDPREIKNTEGSLWFRWSAPDTAPYSVQRISGSQQARLYHFELLSSRYPVPLPFSGTFPGRKGSSYRILIATVGAEEAFAFRLRRDSAKFENLFGLVLDNDARIRVVSLLDPKDLKRIEILWNGQVIGTSETSPFDFRWTNAPWGDHRLTAAVVATSGERLLTEAPSDLVVRPSYGDHRFPKLLSGSTPTMDLAGFTHAENLYFQWDAPADGGIDFGETLYVGLGDLTVGDGIRPFDLVESGFIFRVTGGHRYLIRLYPNVRYPNPASFGTLVARFYPAPANDSVRHATLLTGDSFEFPVSTHWSRFENDPDALRDKWGDVWFRYNPPRKGIVGIFGSDGQLDAWTGPDPADLQGMRPLNLLGSFEQFPVTGEGLFYLRQLGPANSTNVAFYRGKFFGTPVNDTFESALAIEGTKVRVSAAFSYSTPDEGQPAQLNRDATVWWKWTAHERGPARISFDHQGFWRTSRQDVKLRVFQGNDLSSLTEVLSSNDRMFIAQPQTTYYLCVSMSPQRSGEALDVALSLDFTAAPIAADNFADRELIVGDQIEIPGLARAATLEPGEPDTVIYPTVFQSENSVWYEWRPASSGMAKVILQDQLYGIVSVYEGDTLESLKVVAHPAFLETYFVRLLFPVVAGNSYAIRICGGGPFTLVPQVPAHAPKLSVATFRPLTEFVIGVEGQDEVVVEGSADLINWSPIMQYFTDGGASFEMHSGSQFFRLKLSGQ